MSIYLRLLCHVLAFAAGTALDADGAALDNTVKLRGQLVCLPAYGPGTYGVEVSLPGRLHGFRDDHGRCYALLRGKMSEALFDDPQLAGRALILTARILPKSRIIEVVGNLHGVREGKVYELYYYCSICAIESVSPALCMCCRDPVELLERSDSK